METLTDALITTFDRDIDRVIEELSLYENDNDLWHCPNGINNPAGTLGLHLAGNLQHYIGAVLGNSGYKRNRDLEFSRRDAGKEEILDELRKARSSVRETLENLDAERLDGNYPLLFHDKQVTMKFMLIHLSVHLNYHLGQLNYLRRLTN